MALLTPGSSGSWLSELSWLSWLSRSVRASRPELSAAAAQSPSGRGRMPSRRLSVGPRGSADTCALGWNRSRGGLELRPWRPRREAGSPADGGGAPAARTTAAGRQTVAVPFIDRLIIARPLIARPFVARPLIDRRGVAAGLALGFAADRVFGDPRRGHPVAVFGRAAQRVEGVLWRDERPAGVWFVAAAVGVPSLLTLAAQVRLSPAGRAALTAGLTWAALGGLSLEREAEAMGRLLAVDDPQAELEPARARLGHLCSRDASDLSRDEIARAAVESVAENTSDAVTGPLLWGALAGPAGIVAYRCANTLDAMVGYRSPRYERFGWAAARLDDALNVVPARLTAALTMVLAPLVGGHPHEAWQACRRGALAHPSPNAGVVEASAAGALGIRLGGTNRYGGRLEQRGELGSGRPARPDDLPRVARLSRLLGRAALVTCVALTIGRRRG